MHACTYLPHKPCGHENLSAQVFTSFSSSWHTCPAAHHHVHAGEAPQTRQSWRKSRVGASGRPPQLCVSALVATLGWWAARQVAWT
eukprot:scaffold132397_cov24-Tisochrysis_lutea.AAC.1